MGARSVLVRRAPVGIVRITLWDQSGKDALKPNYKQVAL